VKKTDKNLCPLCGSDITTGKTTFTVDLSFGLFVVRNVPATICSQCGEEWINNKTAQQLEQMVSEARKRKHELQVVAL
jgi:YgiT-type zinc finger domain-containing protein